MALYEYKCTECGTHADSEIRTNSMQAMCTTCGPPRGYTAVVTTWKRVWSVSFAPVMQEHFNRTLGKPVSDMKRFRDELRAAGNKATDETGIPHRYEPVDMSDHEGLGVTGEGLYESNVERSKRGEPLLPMPPGS